MPFEIIIIFSSMVLCSLKYNRLYNLKNNHDNRYRLTKIVIVK